MRSANGSGKGLPWTHVGSLYYTGNMHPDIGTSKRWMLFETGMTLDGSRESGRITCKTL